MDIQLDQMRSKNAKKVAHSKSNVKMGNFMDTVNNTDGIYGDKDKKKGDGKPKMSKKGGLTFVHDGDTKYLHGGDYTTKGGFNFSGENTSPVVKGLKPYAGAGFVIAYTGAIMTMPGLPKRPAAENMDISEEGKIKGLF